MTKKLEKINKTHSEDARVEGTVAMLHREIDDLLDEVGYCKEIHVEQIRISEDFALELDGIQEICELDPCKVLT